MQHATFTSALRPAAREDLGDAMQDIEATNIRPLGMTESAAQKE
ncbi:MAG: hypothetical protein ACLFTT_14200 [Candidatus Hydrogenedentota bacterium]